MAESRYRILHRLKGHRDAVNCVLFFHDGNLLISGGDDQLIHLWDINTGDCVQTLTNEKWGQITALSLYEPTGADPADATLLFIGTARGAVTTYPLSPAGPYFNSFAGITRNVFAMNDSVESQALDPLNRCFVVASHQGSVKMFNIDGGKLSANPIWMTEMGDIPRSLIFIGDSNHHVLILTLYQGELACVKADVPIIPEEVDGEVAEPTHVSTRRFQANVGSAALSPDGRTLVIHNLRSDEFEIYHPLDADQPSKSLLVSRRNDGHLLKQCAFGEDGGQAIICGGNYGQLFVFDTTGNCLQTLSHKGDTSTIYGIATTSSEDNHYIASAETEDPPSIFIWAKPTDEKILAERLHREAQATQDALEIKAAEEAKKLKEDQDAQKAKLDKIASLNRRFSLIIIAVSLLIILALSAFFWLLKIGAITIHAIHAQDLA